MQSKLQSDTLPSGRQPWIRKPPMAEGAEFGTSLLALLVGGYMAGNGFLKGWNQLDIIAFPASFALFVLGAIGLWGIFHRSQMSGRDVDAHRR